MGYPIFDDRDGIPKVERIREQAADILAQVWDGNEPDLVINIGGLEADRSENALHLRFIPRTSHLDMRPQVADPAVSPTEKALYAAAQHLSKTERGRHTLKGLRLMMDHSYSLDAGNIKSVVTLLSGFYGSFTGTASDAINDQLEAE